MLLLIYLLLISSSLSRSTFSTAVSLLFKMPLSTIYSEDESDQCQNSTTMTGHFFFFLLSMCIFAVGCNKTLYIM